MKRRDAVSEKKLLHESIHKGYTMSLVSRIGDKMDQYAQSHVSSPRFVLMNRSMREVLMEDVGILVNGSSNSNVETIFGMEILWINGIEDGDIMFSNDPIPNRIAK